ncbi:MAG: sirohydrochlorin nickelochelatase [Methanoregula sp.]|jgi:sirohydrochlorin cobaltochelatase|uniref:sirohydrochlorin nickelochelatase n=1 Tax=Methanoregula sp. TaxID=2052170 RepID=UPI0025CF1FB4|nr:sirohydrochlorin nickelochelatase [Methanoregula sp.]MCK9632362.1 sirohydrochlorin nickelochelatase [Methanoregula sp.]
MEKKGLLLVGHGSSLPYNQELAENTAALIQKKYPEYIVKCGFMRVNNPTIPESLDAFREEPIDALVVVPLFLAKGVHINQDIPRRVGLLEGETRGSFAMNGRTVPLHYAGPIGVDPLLADMMIKNANLALTLI